MRPFSEPHPNVKRSDVSRVAKLTAFASLRQLMSGALRDTPWAGCGTAVALRRTRTCDKEHCCWCQCGLGQPQPFDAGRPPSLGSHRRGRTCAQVVEKEGNGWRNIGSALFHTAARRCSFVTWEPGGKHRMGLRRSRTSATERRGFNSPQIQDRSERGDRSGFRIGGRAIESVGSTRRRCVGRAVRSSHGQRFP